MDRYIAFSSFFIVLMSIISLLTGNTGGWRVFVNIELIPISLAFVSLYSLRDRGVRFFLKPAFFAIVAPIFFYILFMYV